MVHLLTREEIDTKELYNLHSKGNFDRIPPINERATVRTVALTEITDSGEPDNGYLVSSILSESPNLYKQKSDFVSKEPFFKLIKCIHETSAWKGAKLKYRAFFYEIAAKAVWQEKDFSWNGDNIVLQPGQWCSSIRRMAEEFSPKGLRGKSSTDHFSKNDIEGAIKYFVKHRFLRQEIRHDVTILTICHTVIYEENYNQNQTVNQTIIRQKSDTKEEVEDLREEYISSDKQPKNEVTFVPSSFAIALLSDFYSSLFLAIPDFPKGSAKKTKTQYQAAERIGKNNNYDIGLIKSVIEFAHQPGGFWLAHVHSVCYLDKKFVKLLQQMKNPMNKTKTRSKFFASDTNAELDWQPKYIK